MSVRKVLRFEVWTTAVYIPPTWYKDLGACVRINYPDVQLEDVDGLVCMVEATTEWIEVTELVQQAIRKNVPVVIVAEDGVAIPDIIVNCEPTKIERRYNFRPAFQYLSDFVRAQEVVAALVKA